MRILLTADAELPVPPRLYGGIERVIALLVSEFVAAGHEVGLVGHPDSTANATKLFPWPGRSSRDWSDSYKNAAALHSAVGSFEPDIVHSFSRLLWLLPLALDARPKIMLYQRDPTGRTVAWSRRVHGNKLRFTGCSNYICERGRERGGGSWTSIPNFVDENSYTFVPKVPKDAPLIFLSRIEQIKGAHNAIAIARKNGRRLLIAGNVVEQGEGARYWREEIKPQIGKNGIEFIGPVDDKQKNELLGQAAALVVPIEWEEPFGIVFVEALACGTPVISCPRGALPEIIRNGEEGFLVSDVEQGCAAVEKLSTISREACRRRVEAEFSSGVVAEKYLTLYSKAAGQANSPE